MLERKDDLNLWYKKEIPTFPSYEVPGAVFTDFADTGNNIINRSMTAQGMIRKDVDLHEKVFKLYKMLSRNVHEISASTINIRFIK